LFFPYPSFYAQVFMHSLSRELYIIQADIAILYSFWLKFIRKTKKYDLFS